MKKKHLIITLIFVLVLSCILTGCANKEEPETTATTTQVTTTEAPPPVYNPLTGRSGASEASKGNRPVAVMINNIKASLPQYGI